MFSHCNKFYVGPTLFTLSLFIRLHTSLHRVDWRLPIFSFLILTSVSVGRGIFRTQSNIYDGEFCENSNRTLNHLAKLALNDWSVFWVLICMVHLTLCSVMSRTLFRVNPQKSYLDELSNVDLYEEEGTVRYYYCCDFKYNKIIALFEKRHNHVISKVHSYEDWVSMVCPEIINTYILMFISN